ncbi:MAG: hypothetical protein DRZ82_03710 [Thermoprotei archaeon]|nr:MAG: hypothetical protein DRZ82_03710 [Thermoprotei archaeon]
MCVNQIRLLLTLEVYTLGSEKKMAKIIEEALRNEGLSYGANVEKGRKRRITLTVNKDDLNKVCKILRSIEGISHIIPFYVWDKPFDLDSLIRDAVNIVKDNVPSNASFKVVVRKLHEDESITRLPSSVELSRIIGMAIQNELKLKADLVNPDYIVHIQLSKDGYSIGCCPLNIYAKRRCHLEKDFFNRLVIIFEKPRLKGEVMDMLRLCAAMNVELRIITDKQSMKVINEAKKEMETVYSKANIKIYKNLDDALVDVVPIAFTRYASTNERELIRILKSESGRIGIMIGNEYTGLSIEARQKAKYSIRIGPELGLSLRGVTVAAYVLGFYAVLQMLNSTQ